MMPWPFADCNRSSAQTEEGFGRGTDELGVRIHRFPWNVFNDVRLQKNGFASDIQIEEPESLIHEFVEFVRVLVCTQRSSQHSRDVASSDLERQPRPSLRSMQEARWRLYRCAESERTRRRSHCRHSSHLEGTRGRATSPFPTEFDSRLVRSDNKEPTVR